MLLLPQGPSSRVKLALYISVTMWWNWLFTSLWECSKIWVHCILMLLPCLHSGASRFIAPFLALLFHHHCKCHHGEKKKISYYNENSFDLMELLKEFYRSHFENQLSTKKKGLYQNRQYNVVERIWNHTDLNWNFSSVSN